ncbi:glycosyltransferase family 87 protein [Aurantiacibacter spongiae]|uniref:DUF2029 domain-containing protein n=1 Tax=Aurantiacibacter spongiae TaxID=2488860 RepID=A0A3N5DPL7_9SPHN|nr:glycosyltransferase family 87 protein [Aurantiacibacter spongiae]RPF71071.1 DUF2029 domain-containing protein [Aurantiacibacter spongiae]
MRASVLDLCRTAEWLTARRVRGYAVILILASIGLLANSYVKAMGTDGTDFLAFWGAGHVTAGGDPSAAYDLSVQERVQTATGSKGWFAFVNPPPFLFVAAPFGWLSFPLAWVAWVGSWFMLWTWATIRAFPRYWLPVLAFPGALLAAGHAQTGLLTGALLVSGVTLLDRRPLLSGALLGALVIKPHLALLVPFWLAAGGRWRSFTAAGTSALALLTVSWVVFGTQTMLAYTTSWDASAAIMASDDPQFYLRMASVYSQLRLFATPSLALATNAVVMLGLVGLAMFSWRQAGGDAMASGTAMLTGTALASPYLFNYDLPFLIVPILWLANEGRTRGFRSFEKLALIGLFLAPYATRAAALPLGVNLMPLASAILCWLVWTRAGRTARGKTEGADATNRGTAHKCGELMASMG